MSKFIFTGCLLLLLASFLNYPAQSVSAKSNVAQESRVIFPISEQIKLARMEKQITSKELASRVGLTKMSVEKMEKGQLVPTHEILQKLEIELGTQLNLDGY
jgi:ribosome-binding protein aMBF1 (putative translation factor)